MTGLTERLVVVGGDAAGMSAASQAKRLAGDKRDLASGRRYRESFDHLVLATGAVPW